MNIGQFVKEQEEALLSLNKEKILAYAKKYDIQLPQSEKAFWGGVHKAICSLPSASPEQKEISKNWLLENGFYPGIITFN